MPANRTNKRAMTWLIGVCFSRSRCAAGSYKPDYDFHPQQTASLCHRGGLRQRRGSSDAQRGQHSERLKEGNADQYRSELLRVHVMTKHQRRDRQPAIQPGINEAVNTPVGSLAESRGRGATRGGHHATARQCR